MTDLEILEKTIATLNNIQVPAAFTKAIGVPIYNSIMDLTALHDSIVEHIRKNQAEEKKDEPETVVDEAVFVPEGDEPPKGAENAEPIQLYPAGDM